MLSLEEAVLKYFNPFDLQNSITFQSAFSCHSGSPKNHILHFSVINSYSEHCTHTHTSN